MPQADLANLHRNTVLGLGLGAALAAVAVAASGALGSPRAPNLALLAGEPLATQLHVAAAVAAFAIGAVLLLGRKGTLPHRALGWTWVAAMGTTAVSSLFILDLNDGAFSLIHLLSGWTIVALPAAVYAARRHRVAAHRRAMSSLYLGGMLIAGGLTFLPGRLMARMFVG